MLSLKRTFLSNLLNRCSVQFLFWRVHFYFTHKRLNNTNSLQPVTFLAFCVVYWLLIKLK